MKSRRLIATSALLTFGIVSLAEVQRHDQLPGADQWLGFVVAFFLIAAADDLGASWAGGLALLLMVATLLSRGDDALAFAASRREAAKIGRPLTAAEKQALQHLAQRRGTRIPHLRPITP